MNGFIPHCGYCGRPLRDCAGCADERAALMRAVCDAMTPVGITAPISTPAPPAGRFVKRGFYMCCAECGMQKSFCKGHTPPDASLAQDGQAAQSLERRIADCKGK